MIASCVLSIPELILIIKTASPNKERVNFWSGMFCFYFTILQVLILGLYFTRSSDNDTYIELQIEVNLTFLLVMRNILLRHYAMVYSANLCLMALLIILIPDKFSYFFLSILIGQMLYGALLGTSIHQREMIFRKCVNYERILEVET